MYLSPLCPHFTRETWGGNLRFWRSHLFKGRDCVFRPRCHLVFSFGMGVSRRWHLVFLCERLDGSSMWWGFSSSLGWGFGEDGILSFHVKGLMGVQWDGVFLLVGMGVWRRWHLVFLCERLDGSSMGWSFPPLWDGGLAKMASGPINFLSNNEVENAKLTPSGSIRAKSNNVKSIHAESV